MFEEHYDTFVVLPTLILQRGTCEDPECEEGHWAVRVGWLFWTVGIEV